MTSVVNHGKPFLYNFRSLPGVYWTREKQRILLLIYLIVLSFVKMDKSGVYHKIKLSHRVLMKK